MHHRLESELHQGEKMKSLKGRIETLEQDRAQVNLKAMSDAELSAYIKTTVSGAREFYAAVVNQILRHPSKFTVVRESPKLLPLYPKCKEKVVGWGLLNFEESSDIGQVSHIPCSL